MKPRPPTRWLLIHPNLSSLHFLATSFHFDCANLTDLTRITHIVI